MSRWGAAAVLAGCELSSRTASADAIHTNLADWQTAATAAGTVSSLQLVPNEVPDTGATGVDDELTLTVGENHVPRDAPGPPLP